MTIHELFTQEDQAIITEALERYCNFCKKQANAPIRGYGKATEYAKKDKWRQKQNDIEALQSYIVEITF